MRVLVTGGRNYQDWRHVYTVLSKIHYCETPISCLIEGGATGADTLARGWAIFNDVPVETYHADWKRFQRRAGPIRNRDMATKRIDLCVPFPGGNGTNDMVAICRAKGIRIYGETG